MTKVEDDSSGGLKKALLKVVGGDDELPLHFNPKSLAVTKGANWSQPNSRSAPLAPPPDFTGTAARKIALAFTLDAPSTGRDVAADATLLQSWCNPTQESIDKGTPQPPLLRLEWTSVAAFDTYLNQANVTYVLFKRDGSPLRATVDAALTESPSPPAPQQNPTSGGPPGNRTHVLSAGETLQSLAYRQYRDATLWRGLARFNRIDDPLRLRPGKRLDLPPDALVRELAR